MSIRRWIEGAALGLLAGAAQADACHEALARFDYTAATQLAASAPASALSRMCAARAAYETGHFADALTRLREVEAAHPQGETRTYLYNWLTVTLRKLGREAEAMQYGDFWGSQVLMHWKMQRKFFLPSASASRNLPLMALPGRPTGLLMMVMSSSDALT